MNIKINPGVIVQINSTKVPWLTYLLLIPDFPATNLVIMEVIIQPTEKSIIIK